MSDNGTSRSDIDGRFRTKCMDDDTRKWVSYFCYDTSQASQLEVGVPTLFLEEPSSLLSPAIPEGHRNCTIEHVTMTESRATKI